MVGVYPVICNGPQHRLVKLVHLPGPVGVRAGRRHGNAAVSHHGGCDSLGQEHIPKLPAVKRFCITVPVYINEPRSYRHALCIDHLVRTLFLHMGSYFPYPVILYI